MRNSFDSSTVLEGLRSALEMTFTAVETLDRVGAPAHLAAHLDLAAHKLRDAIATIES